MFTWLRRFALSALTLSAIVSCGGSSPAGPGNPGGSDLTARVDGQAWAADALATSAIAGPSGIFVIVGSQNQSGVLSSISISLWNIRGTGTYAMGTGPTVFGGIGFFSEASQTWSTPLTGTAGSITITTLTPTQIAGTFQYSAMPDQGNPSGQTRSLTGGAFDLPLSTNGSLPVVPANAGGLASATINGAAYNASLVFASRSQTGNGLGFTSSDLDRTLTVDLAGVTAPGTYPLGQAGGVLIIVTDQGVPASNPNCCWGLQPTDVGSVTFTTVTADRMTGTFSGTLHSAAGATNQPLVISNGVFDVGR